MLSLGLALWAMALPRAARGDVVMPPPTNCPDGAKGRTSHAGPHCAPRTCERGCDEGMVCKPMPLCVVQRQGANRMRKFTFDVVTAACPGGAKCETGACETREVCVPGTVEPAPAPADPDAAAPEPAVAPATPPAEPPDAQVVEDQKLGTETRKPAACSVGAGDEAWALAIAAPVALLALLGMRRRRPAG